MGAETNAGAPRPLRDPPDGSGMIFVAGGVDGTAETLAPLFEWLRGLAAGQASEAGWWRWAEWTDRVLLEEAPPEVPDDLPRLVWGRWFGKAGDLELWREGERFRWRFLGEAGVCPPPSVGCRDYFAEADEDGAPRVLRQGEDRVGLLWKPDDARVATADAETLALLAAAPGRLRLRYTPFYDRGVVAAVRYQRIELVGGSSGSTTQTE